MEAQILQLMNEEVERRLNDKIYAVLENISKAYHLPIEQLMRDASTVAVSNDTCMGRTNQGNRCKSKVCKQQQNGYCKKHQKQKPNIVQTVQNTTKHTHGPHIMHMAGCPECIKKRPTPLVDI
jgi:hypothetical protein